MGWLDDTLDTILTPVRWLDEGATAFDKFLDGVPGTALTAFETLGGLSSNPYVKGAATALSITQELVKDLGRYQIPGADKATVNRNAVKDVLIKPLLPTVTEQLLKLTSPAIPTSNPVMGNSNAKDWAQQMNATKKAIPQPRRHASIKYQPGKRPVKIVTKPKPRIARLA